MKVFLVMQNINDTLMSNATTFRLYGFCEEADNRFSH